MLYQASWPLTAALFTVLLFCSSLFTANAEEHSQSGLNVSFIREMSTGILVGFTSTPNDCTGSLQGVHANLSRSAPQFDETLIRLTSANLMGVQVTAYYTDIGDCIDEKSLLQLSNIEIQ